MSSPAQQPSAKTRRLKSAAVVIAAIAALGALLSGLGAFKGDKPADAGNNNRITNTGDSEGCIVFITGSNNTTTCLTLSAALADPKITDDQIKKALNETSAQQPGKGPWQYVVLDTEAYGGLKIRSGPRRDDIQIGSTANRGILWADCQLTSDFDPDRTLPTGPVWLKIHWPNTKPTKNFFNSQPADPTVGWAHRGYAHPAGHNGKIPTCRP